MYGDVTEVEKRTRYTRNKGKNTLHENICHCNSIQFFPEHVMLKSYNISCCERVVAK